jgi:hypothetical protein
MAAAARAAAATASGRVVQIDAGAYCGAVSARTYPASPKNAAWHRLTSPPNPTTKLSAMARSPIRSTLVANCT